MATPKVLFIMADYGHDPTETAVPFLAFRDAGFEVEFATENGVSPQCDSRMLTGLTQKLLGATATACDAYAEMRASSAIQNPYAWTSSGFTLDYYNLVFVPGGHDKAVRQILDSRDVRSHLAAYFPTAIRGSKRAVAAICHGVLAVSETMIEDANLTRSGYRSGGKSILHDAVTTTLPGTFENTAYWSTKAFLGDYYKTYGKGSENVEESVKRRLNNPKTQYRCSITSAPFVVEDGKYNYLSARYPGDAELLAKKAIAMVRTEMK